MNLNRRSCHFIVAAAAILSVFVPVPGRADMVVYDLKSDWNPPANPNGAWLYNAGNVALPYQTYADWLTGPAYSLNPNISSLEVARHGSGRSLRPNHQMPRGATSLSIHEKTSQVTHRDLPTSLGPAQRRGW